MQGTGAAMADGATSLPSLSSVLKWVRREADAEASQPESPPASNKRTISEVGDDDIPAPLSAHIIHRAMSELPQGACVALESCINALKVSTAFLIFLSQPHVALEICACVVVRTSASRPASLRAGADQMAPA